MKRRACFVERYPISGALSATNYGRSQKGTHMAGSDLKNRVLDAWTMVEHLSEGDFNPRDTANHKLTLNAQDFYGLFGEAMRKKGSGKKGGIVLFLNTFPFERVIRMLHEKFQLEDTDEDISYGTKFSLSLSFDRELNLLPDNTFLTESAYFLEVNSILDEDKFQQYEEEQKETIEKLFYAEEEDGHRDTHTSKATPRKFFNRAMRKFITHYNLQDGQCYYRAVKNLDSDVTNLHSFFVDDLQRAKETSTKNLDAYLYQQVHNDRVDLDANQKSPNFNPLPFYDILQPKYYQLGRFPSHPEYALSLMQQVAVNLSTHRGDEQIRSVNGPPGTGKTTLLKDIFAELIVQQSYEMALLQGKNFDVPGSNGPDGIGELPDSIADKGIVVASSNNGAVQNIVNELPLTKEVDHSFQEALIKADYFTEIANSDAKEEWVQGEDSKKHKSFVVKPTDSEDPNKFWGLFSLEGGRKANVEKITTDIDRIVKYFDEHVPNDGVYAEFLDAYKKQEQERDKRQSAVDTLNQVSVLESQLNSHKTDFTREYQEREANLKQLPAQVERTIRQIQSRIGLLQAQKQQIHQSRVENAGREATLNQQIDALKLQKPGVLQLSKKREYDQKMAGYSTALQDVIGKKQELKEAEVKQDRLIAQKQAAGQQAQTQLKQEQADFEAWKYEQLYNMQQEEQQLAQLKQENAEFSYPRLNLNEDYDKLEISNPWFDKEYRIQQSKLFILALRVRKQFLYDNRKSLSKATWIWGDQQKFMNENPDLIVKAWHWINLTIPVISTTFASSSRMFKNLPPETIGRLFVDEAGQALPQASVGAIMRSRNVMVVGDPAQIKPVLTLDSKVLGLLGRHYFEGLRNPDDLAETYISENSSTQTLIDAIGKYGFYKDKEKTDWIGIPLWVHRRCQYPMFDISNDVSYNGNMVQGNKGDGAAKWFDIGGSANNKYVSEQGQLLHYLIKKMAQKNHDILDPNKKDVTYVISPFKNVADRLKKELNSPDLKFTRRDHGKVTNIGTVHTFQGKEAPIVFLVLGADEKSKGAANWAMGSSNPNIMNVAATRAKKQFYVIGDLKLYRGLGSDVIKKTLEAIDQFNQRIQKSNTNADQKEDFTEQYEEGEPGVVDGKALLDALEKEFSSALPNALQNAEAGTSNKPQEQRQQQRNVLPVTQNQQRQPQQDLRPVRNYQRQPQQNTRPAQNYWGNHRGQSRQNAYPAQNRQQRPQYQQSQRNSRPMPQIIKRRVDLNVPYEEKDEAKKLGARWDYKRKTWYVRPGSDLNEFRRWLK